MKKIFTRVISAAMTASLLACTAATAYADTEVQPDYPIHGNKCGAAFVCPNLDRDVYIKITQLTEDGDYVYYNTVIPAAAASNGSEKYFFNLEGKDDVTYNITIGVPKYKSSKEPEIYTYEFAVKDTDNITNGAITGYSYTFNISGGSDYESPFITESFGPAKNEQNIVEMVKNIQFPISDILVGDVNFNGVIDLQDAIMIAKYLLDKNFLKGEQLSAGDYNQNGAVDLQDAVGIAKKLVGK